jgi:transcriptional regulator with XRE-family HTH domain
MDLWITVADDETAIGDDEVADGDELAGQRVGTQVVMARKLSGLTQVSLAARMNYSSSSVSQVERGVVAASPAFVAAAAKALGVTVAELWRQPVAFGVERRHVAQLETAVIEGGDAVEAGTRRLPTIGTLAALLERVAVLQRRARYQESSRLLPTLLRGLHQAADLAAAGRDSGDPLLAAFAEANKGVPLLYRGSFAVAERVVTRAGTAADAEPDTSHAFAVRGAMQLQLAILAARTGHAATAEAHLAQARDLARWVPDLGPEADYYDTGFSATNVELHAVASAVELGDGTTALSRGAELHIPDSVMRSRRGHHHIDMASAALLHGDRDRAFAELQRARRITPEQTRYHPGVREVLATVTPRPATCMRAWYSQAARSRLSVRYSLRQTSPSGLSQANTRLLRPPVSGRSRRPARSSSSMLGSRRWRLRSSSSRRRCGQ